MSFLKSVDWSKVLSYGYHIGLLAGSVALRAYAPEAYTIWGPVIQAVAQSSPTPEGITLVNK